MVTYQKKKHCLWSLDFVTLSFIYYKFQLFAVSSMCYFCRWIINLDQMMLGAIFVILLHEMKGLPSNKQRERTWKERPLERLPKKYI